MRDSLSEPDFYGDLVFNYRRLVSKAVNPLYTDTRYNDRFIKGVKHGFSNINIRCPVGGVENRGRRPRFSTPPKGPGEC